MIHRRNPQRLGLSLLEVLVALGIFLISMVVINQMIQTASRTALRTQRLTKAALLCEAKMEEIVAGVLPLQSSGKQAVDGSEPEWLFEVNVEPEGWSAVTVDSQSLSGLSTVHVTVLWGGARTMKPVEYTLTRLVLDPRLRVPLADPVTSTTSTSSN
jgi:Tfp pilus assembly protein PilV